MGVRSGSKNLYAVAEDAVGFMLTLNLQYSRRCPLPFPLKATGQPSHDLWSNTLDEQTAISSSQEIE